MSSRTSLVKNPVFRKQARSFAKWYSLQRTAALEAGKIAAEWMERYSRTRNAARLADALFDVTGVRVTGRTLRNYRDIYVTAEMYRQRSRRAKSGNDFHFRHVGPTHLLAVARTKLPGAVKVRILNEIERENLTVLRTKARLAQLVIEAERAKQTVKCPRNGPRVVRGDAIDVVKTLPPRSIHQLFCDWQWDNSGVWRESMTAGPVYRPDDPIDHLCRFLTAARPQMRCACIVWIFSKATAFEDGQIGLPWKVQQVAHDLGLRYCSEYIAPHKVSGYQSKDSFLSTAHTPIHPYVPEDFDLPRMEFANTVGQPRTSPNHISQLTPGKERHPYEKPVELFEDLIRMGTPGGLVFDGFAGSGASGAAAVRCGCSFLGSEMQPQYVRMANRTIADAIARQGRETEVG